MFEPQQWTQLELFFSEDSSENRLQLSLSHQFIRTLPNMSEALAVSGYAPMINNITIFAKLYTKYSRKSSVKKTERIEELILPAEE